MKKIEKLEKYVIVPNVGFYGGFRYEGGDIELCDDVDQDTGYLFHVRQKIEKDKLITDIERSYERQPGKVVKETSHLEVDIECGQLLVYVEGLGYTLPEYRMCSIDEAMEQYELLR